MRRAHRWRQSRQIEPIQNEPREKEWEGCALLGMGEELRRLPCVFLVSRASKSETGTIKRTRQPDRGVGGGVDLVGVGDEPEELAREVQDNHQEEREPEKCGASFDDVEEGDPRVGDPGGPRSMLCPTVEGGE